MSWRDEFREEKEASGLTWDEFHEQEFVHVDDLDGLRETIEGLREDVNDLAGEYRQTKRELHEVRLMLESDEFEP